MPRPVLLAAAFVTLLAAACTVPSHVPGGQDRDKLTMYVHIRMADAVFAAEAAAQGVPQAFDTLADLRADLQSVAPHLDKGLQTSKSTAFESKLGQSVQAMGRLLRDRETVLDAIGTGNNALVRLPRMSAQMAEVVRGISESGAPVSQVNIANRQIVLLDRMGRRIDEVIRGGDAGITAADALQRDLTVFDKVLQALDTGSPDLGIARVEQPAARAAIANVIALNRDHLNDVNRFLAAARTLADAHQAVAELRTNRLDLQDAAPPGY
jgi:twitching motility protein PilJ